MACPCCIAILFGILGALIGIGLAIYLDEAEWYKELKMKWRANKHGYILTLKDEEKWVQ